VTDKPKGNGGDEVGENLPSPAVSGTIVPRDSKGRFGAGNPGGGRRKMPDEIREILEAATPEAAQAIVAGLRATKGDGQSPDWKERREYACALFERLYGRPAQAVQLEDEDGKAVAVGVIFLPQKEGA
jgi:hypothetical protein